MMQKIVMRDTRIQVMAENIVDFKFCSVRSFDFGHFENSRGRNSFCTD